MKIPLVSVLLPLREAAAHLEACLGSLAAQSLRDFEVVAVDHASSDAGPAILEAWRARLPALRVLRVEGGELPAALNAGLELCRAAYVARMDADDICHPRRLELQAACLEANPQIALLGSRVDCFGEEPLSEGAKAYQEWINSLLEAEDLLRERFIECPLPHPSWMFRRQAVAALGAYGGEGWPEDYDLLLRAAEAGLGLGKLPQPLLRWRQHPARHSKAHPRYRREAFFRLKARHLARLAAPSGACAVWGAGDRGRLLIRQLQLEGARVAFCVGAAEGAGRRATSAHGVEVIPPERLPGRLPGPLFVCVGSPGVRPRVRDWMRGRPWREGEDWLFAS